MNPLTNVKNITKLNEIELSKGLTNKKSWHDMYSDSAWIFIGGLAYGLTEGDILTVFSQYGEIVNINMVRQKDTGKTRGFCFICYANQKSTTLAVDNLNGIKLCNRTLRVDHVANYKIPKDHEDDDQITKFLRNEGCAPRAIKEHQSPDDSAGPSTTTRRNLPEKRKDQKKHKKSTRSSSSSSNEASDKVVVKKEKYDPGYEKYSTSTRSQIHTNKRPNKTKSSRWNNSDSDHERNYNVASSSSHKTERCRSGNHNVVPSTHKTANYPDENHKVASSSSHQKEKNCEEDYSFASPSHRRDKYHKGDRSTVSASHKRERYQDDDHCVASTSHTTEKYFKEDHNAASSSSHQKKKHQEKTKHKRNRQSSESSSDSEDATPVHKKTHTKKVQDSQGLYKNNSWGKHKKNPEYDYRSKSSSNSSASPESQPKKTSYSSSSEEDDDPKTYSSKSPNYEKDKNHHKRKSSHKGLYSSDYDRKLHYKKSSKHNSR